MSCQTISSYLLFNRNKTITFWLFKVSDETKSGDFAQRVGQGRCHFPPLLSSDDRYVVPALLNMQCFSLAFTYTQQTLMSQYCISHWIIGAQSFQDFSSSHSQLLLMSSSVYPTDPLDPSLFMVHNLFFIACIPLADTFICGHKEASPELTFIQTTSFRTTVFQFVSETKQPYFTLYMSQKTWNTYVSLLAWSIRISYSMECSFL